MKQGHQSCPISLKVGVILILLLHVLTHSVNAAKTIEIDEIRLSLAPESVQNFVITKVTLGRENFDKDPGPEEYFNVIPSTDSFTFNRVPLDKEIVLYLTTTAESDIGHLNGKLAVTKDILLQGFKEATIHFHRALPDRSFDYTVPYLVKFTNEIGNPDILEPEFESLPVNSGDDDDASSTLTTGRSFTESLKQNAEGIQIGEKNFKLRIKLKNPPESWSDHYEGVVTIPEWVLNQKTGELWTSSRTVSYVLKVEPSSVPKHQTILFADIPYFGIIDHRSVQITFYEVLQGENTGEKVGWIEQFSIPFLFMDKKVQIELTLKSGNGGHTTHDVEIKAVLGVNKISYLTIGAPVNGFDTADLWQLQNPLRDNDQLFGWGTHPLWPTITFIEDDLQGTGIDFYVRNYRTDQPEHETTNDKHLNIASWETLNSKDSSQPKDSPLKWTTTFGYPAWKYLKRKNAIVVPIFHDDLRASPEGEDVLSPVQEKDSSQDQDEVVERKFDSDSQSVQSLGQKSRFSQALTDDDSTMKETSELQTKPSPYRNISYLLIKWMSKLLEQITRDGVYFRPDSKNENLKHGQFGFGHKVARYFEDFKDVEYDNARIMLDAIYGVDPEEERKRSMSPCPTTEEDTIVPQVLSNLVDNGKAVMGKVGHVATKLKLLPKEFNIHIVASGSNTAGKVEDLLHVYPYASLIIFDFEEKDNSQLNVLDRALIIPVLKVLELVHDLETTETVVTETDLRLSESEKIIFKNIIMNLVVPRIEMAIVRHAEKRRLWARSERQKRKSSGITTPK